MGRKKPECIKSVDFFYFQPQKKDEHSNGNPHPKEKNPNGCFLLGILRSPYDLIRLLFLRGSIYLFLDPVRLGRTIQIPGPKYQEQEKQYGREKKRPCSDHNKLQTDIIKAYRIKT
jgi:hypothetical protein